MKLKRIIGVVLIGLSSCAPETLFDQTIKIEHDYWLYEDQADFILQVEDTTKVSELQLVIDHKTSYPYENIYLKVNTQFPEGKKQEERLSINLADKSGKWIGKCNAENCKLKVYLLERFKFPTTGEYHFKFEQHSRQDSLRGINALQLIVLPLDEEKAATEK